MYKLNLERLNLNKPTEFKEKKQSRSVRQSKMIPKQEVIRKGYHRSEKLKGKLILITEGYSGIV